MQTFYSKFEYRNDDNIDLKILEEYATNTIKSNISSQIEPLIEIKAEFDERTNTYTAVGSLTAGKYYDRS